MSLVTDRIQQIIDSGALVSAWVNGGPTDVVQTTNGPIQTLAGVNATAAIKIVAALSSSSVSPVVAGIGHKTFEVAAGKSFFAPVWVTITSPVIQMAGPVVSYTGTTLVINVVYSNGVGTGNNWDVVFSGVPGPTGLTGPTGPTGTTGLKGDTGAIGPVGQTGSKGDTGVAGSNGVKGDSGIQGVAGTIGPIGPAGLPGANGTIGLTGAQGIAGPAGSNGTATSEKLISKFTWET